MENVPRPTLAFRLRAWRAFQRALDPLGPVPRFPFRRLAAVKRQQKGSP
jgi:hypothetical protein